MLVKRASARTVRSALLAYARGGRPRRDADPETLYILLQSAWGLGGTIRAAHNLAEYLADHRPVEILSAYRQRKTPAMGSLPAGVTISVLDERRPSKVPRGLAGQVRRVLKSRRSLLMHPADRRYQEWSLWTDVQLVRHLRGRSGLLMGTRPGLNMLVARLDHPRMIKIGIEQMHIKHHEKPLRRAMPIYYRDLDVFVVLTARDEAAYRELLGDGVPLARIPNTARKMPGPRADPDAKIVLSAGRFAYQKGFDLLIPAFASVRDEFPEWRLRVYGRGPLRPELEGLVAQHGIEAFADLPGMSKDLASEMERASIFALSSRFEGFPLTLLEAMSKGMAPVAADCPTGPAEVIDDRRNGILVPAGDADQLAAGLRAMMGDVELRRRCSEAAAQTAAQYTMEAVGPRWDALLERLVEERRRREHG